MKIGYARDSTDDQTLDLQRHALKRTKCREHASDKNTARPQHEACPQAPQIRIDRRAECVARAVVGARGGNLHPWAQEAAGDGDVPRGKASPLAASV